MQRRPRGSSSLGWSNLSCPSPGTDPVAIGRISEPRHQHNTPFDPYTVRFPDLAESPYYFGRAPELSQSYARSQSSPPPPYTRYDPQQNRRRLATHWSSGSRSNSVATVPRPPAEYELMNNRRGNGVRAYSDPTPGAGRGFGIDIFNFMEEPYIQRGLGAEEGKQEEDLDRDTDTITDTTNTAIATPSSPLSSRLSIATMVSEKLESEGTPDDDDDEYCQDIHNVDEDAPHRVADWDPRWHQPPTP
ncbi:hypothetical protein O1611_g8772 [Lasiodiplodia mahajangana]|uniref:Uncharacterized protein n=1 Tax=Lasiodiplodia mahajangana TaxID=1108764 RepID=A0ACC2JBZ9_9PEZI|nr:hypothetical protein O1611_g8772 [Lasiodiplodia mahajangana]